MIYFLFQISSSWFLKVRKSFSQFLLLLLSTTSAESPNMATNRDGGLVVYLEESDGVTISTKCCKISDDTPAKKAST